MLYNRVMKNKKKCIIGIVIVLFVSLFGYGYMYLHDYYHADSVAIAALSSDNDVKVENVKDWIAFEPKTYDTGIIFYPGAKVESEAYAPLCKKYAEDGILVVVVKMPMHFALLNQNAADEVRERFDCAHWYMAGHSLGGVCAGNYLAENADAFDGLVLLASYVTTDLSKTDLKCLSIYGTNDQVLNQKSYEKNQKNLSESDSYEIVISGGNHGQFGSYGFQKGDGKATISAEEQWDICVDGTESIMEN